MSKTLRKALCILLSAALCIAFTPATALAAEDGNLSYATGVTTQMCKASYWKSKTQANASQVLLTADQIRDINSSAFTESSTNLYALENMDGEYDADTLRASLGNNKEYTASQQYYAGTEPIADATEYFEHMNQGVLETGFSGTRTPLYAICVKHADLRAWPTNASIGYSSDDWDDEMQSSALCVNEPFLVKMYAEIDGEGFYWGYSTNCSGWVSAAKFAICSDKQQWLDAWKVDPADDDVLVVTQNKITLEDSKILTSTAKVTLALGTILKLVPAEDMPETLSERNTWNNYVVYLPTRDEEGNYVKDMALVSQHYNVSVGFLPYTQGNLLDVAFACLGDRYGWGGALESFDCSLYTRAIYRCFGFELPRNTTWQMNIPGKAVNLSGLTDEQKADYLATLPAGSLLYFPGHTMMLCGTEDGTSYVISATGSLYDSVGPLEFKWVYNVILNPVTVRRGASYGYTTWLHNLNGAVVFTDSIDLGKNVTLSFENSSIAYNGAVQEPQAIVAGANGNPLPASSYDLAINKAPKLVGTYTATATLKGNLAGTATAKFKIVPQSTEITKLTAKTKGFYVKWAKRTAQTTGYQVRWSTNETMTSAKTKTINSTKTISGSVTKLKAKKTYYVQVRTYKTVGKTKYYSSWSAPASVKTK